MFLIFIFLSISLFARDFPQELSQVPFGEERGIVLDVKTVRVPGCPNAYNASLVAYEEGYKLFFRYDTPPKPPYISRIAFIQLDAAFEPAEETFHPIETSTKCSEDPRVLWLHDKILLSYSGYQKWPGTVPMYLATLDARTMQVENISALPILTGSVEKNWTPFVDNNQILYQYYLYPQSVLAVVDQTVEFFHRDNQQARFWKKSYGQISGGTPAIKISDEEYLGFFHSRFRDSSGFYWYVMGAYTFSTEPPYTMLRISPVPILFHSIYDSWTYHEEKVCIFPAGIVDKGEHIIVSCGENDAAIKIITFDKEKLLKSLAPLESKEKFSRIP